MSSRFEILTEETHFPNSESEKNDGPSMNDLESQLKDLVLGLTEESDPSSENSDTSADTKRVFVKDVKKASQAKELGNNFFMRNQYAEAIECYTTALKYCPMDEEYTYNRAVYFGNRAACLLKQNRLEECVEDCSQSITLSPNYVKALMRRAEAYEKLEKFDESLKDLDNVLQIDPNVPNLRSSHNRIKTIIHERTEKMKAEMMDKLKGFGNTILGKFGLSTENFKMVQDPNTGSYNINFTQNAQN